MANPEHVEILKQGVEVWNRWRKKNPGILPDLEDSNFRMMNLFKGNFKGANLRVANLPEVNFGQASLNGAILEGANLSGATLNDANLKKANLLGADLLGAHLTGASLEKAILIGTKLSYANLSSANLSKTDLKGALLIEAVFKGTNLDEATLSGSAVDNTIFADVDLSCTIGLENVRHLGPSRVDISTIYKSRGQIPEVFLRGCGVPENFIRYMKSLTMNPFEYYSCFISYSHQDKSFARRLHDQLQARGIRCWLDEKQLLPGDDIYEQVDRGIRMWDKVLLCCSKHSLSSWWVDNEVSTAFSKEQQLMKDRKKKVLSLIPLNLDGYMFNDEWDSGKRQQIKERLAADFTGWETDNTTFEEQFERVVKALQTEGARDDAPASRL